MKMQEIIISRENVLSNDLTQIKYFVIPNSVHNFMFRHDKFVTREIPKGGQKLGGFLLE